MTDRPAPEPATGPINSEAVKMLFRTLIATVAATWQKHGTHPFDFATALLAGAVALLSDPKVCDRERGRRAMLDAMQAFDCDPEAGGRVN